MVVHASLEGLELHPTILGLDPSQGGFEILPWVGNLGQHRSFRPRGIGQLRISSAVTLKLLELTPSVFIPSITGTQFACRNEWMSGATRQKRQKKPHFTPDVSVSQCLLLPPGGRKK